jgi:2-polyprenyl-3-methyl-5-hydroxy-6-metoxy-1,4-benzoquinol methylase
MAQSYSYGAPQASRYPHLDAGVPADNYGKRIGILIVAYNAVTTLVQVFRRIPAAVWSNVEEVVVFDDASQDSTYELAVGYQVLSENPKLRILKNARNLGYGGNQKAGYRYFMERGFDVAVLLHGDGQYAPEILAHIYHPIVTGKADAVFGSRMLPGYGGPLEGGMPIYKYVGNRVLTVLENRALGLGLSEFHSGYRAYSLRALREIELERMTDEFHFDTQIIIKLNHQSFRISEVPIPTYYGGEICYVNGFKYAWNVARAVYRYRRTVQAATKYPEFSEYFLRYPLKGGRHSSHGYFRQLVGAGQEVLDCGCGEGFFAAELVKERNRVVGIDVLPAPKAGAVLEHYIKADLSAGLGQAAESLGERRFSRVLLMDILEHLPDPGRLLRDCRRVLKPGGKLLVSIPNVANIAVRLSLLLGRFEYAERGILDRTHLRFFTRRSARRLLEEAGYQIVEQKTTVMPVELALGVRPENRVMRYVDRALAFFTRLMPGLLGYQFVLVARPAAGAEAGLEASQRTREEQEAPSVAADLP